MNIRETYETRISSFNQDANQLKQQNRWLPYVRAFTFLGAGILLALGVSGDLFPGWPLLVVLFVLGFFVAVSVHRKMQRALENAQLMIRLNEHAIARLDGKWHDFPQSGERYENDDHPYAQDLDLLGPNSLFQLLNTTTTRFGEDTLAQWLLEPAALPEIQRRQTHIEDLKERISLRQELEREGLRIGKEAIQQDPELFLRWAESPPTLLNQPLLVWTLRILPLWTTGWLLAYIVAPKISLLLWLIPLIVQFVILGKTTPRVLPHLMDVTSRQRAFSLYAALFQRIDQEPAKDAPFETYQKHFRATGMAPHQAMKRFQFFVDLIDVRHTPMMHLPLNMLLLWDLQCLYQMEKWKSQIGPQVRAWFRELGEIEALCSFATLAHENPTYVFPSVLDAKDAPLQYEATQLGHPLLPSNNRKSNDFSLTPTQPIMLITGSNMSGKSTHLRSIGLNAALAYSGSVVCAHSLTLSWMQIGTSMRIKDSLEHGISYFMAELYRIRRVVRLSEEGAPLLYLLDEILHGTNTIERRKAALGIITLLQQSAAIGVVTTHDLELAEQCKVFEEQIQYTYFTDHIENDKMVFDYILQKGICPSTNALRLMKLVGIPLPEPPDSHNKDS